MNDCVSNVCQPFSEHVHLVIQVCVAVFFAILFLQSGLDKISDRKGNLAWMNPHFQHSPLKNAVPLLLSVLTLMEISTGLLNVAGIIILFVKHCDLWLFWGSTFAAVSLIALFAGQRMAKDYAGAQSLVSYFILSLIGIWLCG